LGNGQEANTIEALSEQLQQLTPEQLTQLQQRPEVQAMLQQLAAQEGNAGGDAPVVPPAVYDVATARVEGEVRRRTGTDVVREGEEQDDGLGQDRPGTPEPM